MQLRQSLFWDVDPNTIDLQKHARYVITRVLDFGTDEEVRWMWRTYSKDQIREILNQKRGVHPRTKALWSLLVK